MALSITFSHNSIYKHSGKEPRAPLPLLREESVYKKVLTTINPIIQGWTTICVQLWGFWRCVQLTFLGSVGPGWMEMAAGWEPEEPLLSLIPQQPHATADELFLYTYGETEAC